MIRSPKLIFPLVIEVMEIALTVPSSFSFTRGESDAMAVRNAPAKVSSDFVFKLPDIRWRKDVSKDDKENAKEFTKESKSMKLTSMLNESFGFGELPSSKLMKMKVSAKDKATGKEQNIKIEASSGLSDEEIEKMKQEAEANSDADNKAKETADKINGADGMIFQTEKQLKEFGEKLSDDKKAPIEEALTELKAAHESKDLEAIDAAMEKINTAWTAASEEIYKAQAAGAAGPEQAGAEQAGGQANGGAKNDTVEDAQFEEVK